MSLSTNTIQKRTLTGMVVSDKMAKTVVVKVDRLIKHPKYEQRYVTSKKYKAHAETPDFHVGDRVVIEETRPISRDKRWKVIKKLSSGRVVTADSETEQGSDAA